MTRQTPKTLGSAHSSSRHRRSFRCCRGVAQGVPKIACLASGINETTFGKAG
ncbi:MAG TPA: hypothetical protein VGA53_01935 [Candidatus Paceibacterota bacterium]